MERPLPVELVQPPLLAAAKLTAPWQVRRELREAPLSELNRLPADLLLALPELLNYNFGKEHFTFNLSPGEQ